MNGQKKKNKFFSSPQFIFNCLILYQTKPWHNHLIGDDSHRSTLSMLKNLNVLLIVGLSFFYFPSHSKEIHKDQESIASSVEEIAEEMINLNESLDSLTTTVSNLFPRSRLGSSLWGESQAILKCDSNKHKRHWNNSLVKLIQIIFFFDFHS